MIIIHQIKLRPGFDESELRKKVIGALRILPDDLISLRIERMSIDARKKPDIFMSVSCVCEIRHEMSVLKRIRNNDSISKYEPVIYKEPQTGEEKLIHNPIIIGSGPCGLFAAYKLAIAGYKPIVCERGYDIDSRMKSVNNFWETGELNTNSNVLFGEGGAGTFSDGKLNTLVKDKYGRNREVLKIFVENGADESIMYDAKPHIGTDKLVEVVKNMRNRITELGGKFRFNAEVTDILFADGKVNAVMINGLERLDCEVVVLAIGHSARNTFKMLYDRKIEMCQKDFAVGFRIQHSQDMINSALYGNDKSVVSNLPPASYKLTYKAENGRGVYSFCMCPGGYVVNASSEFNRLCINGMSYSKRDGKNANSAIVVTVGRDDFEDDSPLAGLRFQEKIEAAAYKAGGGKIPCAYYGNFKNEVNDGLQLLNVPESDILCDTVPEMRGMYCFTCISDVLPPKLNETIVEGIEYFDRIIPGFAEDGAILSAVESRTSSPVRIVRGDDYQSVTVGGLYPAGEGAGYAGGITSAGMDGICVYEAIAKKYSPF